MAAGGQVNAIAVRPDTPGSAQLPSPVYAAVAPPGAYDSGPSKIYKTVDGAVTWTPVFTAEQQVYALGASGSNVYAGAFNQGGEGPSIYVSNDSGMGWTPVFSFTDRGVWLDIDIHPTDPNVAIAGGWVSTGWDQGVVCRTEDAGLNWSPLLTVTVPDDNVHVVAVLMHPITPSLLLAAANSDGSPDGVVYRSEDGGATWPVSVTIQDAQPLVLAAHTITPTILYAGTGGSAMTRGPSQVFRSTDAGQSWSQVLDDAGGRLVFRPPSTVIAVADWGEVRASESNGDPGTWEHVGNVWSPASLDIDLEGHGTAMMPISATLYLGAWNEGVQVSADGGVGWEERNNGIAFLLQPVDIDVDPQDPDKLFVAAECGNGWMSDDGGETWSEISGACTAAYAINPDDPDIVYAGEYNDNQGAVVRSEDGGMNFTPVYTAPFVQPDGSGGDEQIYALAIAPSMSRTVYAGGRDSPRDQQGYGVLLRTLNDGQSWTQVLTIPGDARVEVLTIDPTDRDVVFAGGEDCSTGPCMGFIYRTTDGGNIWTLVFTPTHTVNSIVVNHQKPRVLYANSGYDIFKSIDSGSTWTLIRPCCPSGNRLAIDPSVPSHVYLGGWGYIAETADGGRTWSDWGDPINQGTPEMEPRALTVDTGAPTQTLYGGFDGVWYYQRPAPQPGAPTTVTLSSVPTSTVDDGAIVSALVVDEYENWVVGGTQVVFTTSLGTIVPTTTVTARGVATTTLTSSQAGAATVTATVGLAWDTIQVEFVEGGFEVFLPLVLRNT
jgi:photosystem II stability/assembly factor-like uncharacterized protein